MEKDNQELEVKEKTIMINKIDVNAEFDFDGTIDNEELLSNEIEMTIEEFREFIKDVPSDASVNVVFGRKEN